MKKIFLVLLLLIPISVNALNINVNGEVKENQEIQGSSVVLGNYVENTSKVSGLDMTLGNTIKYEGESEYLLSAGNNIEINGTVKNDGFVFGNVVNFNENSVIERDLLVLANNVTISGTIKKDVTIYAATVTINGTIENVNVKANEIIIENLETDSVFGTNMSLTNNENYEIIAKENCQVVVIDYDNLINPNNLNHNFFNIFLMNLFDITNKKIREKNERIRVLEKKQIRDKLLEFFEIEYKKSYLKRIFLPFSLKNLADYMGVNRSAMFRELKHLKEDHLIEIKGKEITLLYK